MMENKRELCEADIWKNIVLAELGKPLTLPLATLKRNCEFKKKWDESQIKWHSIPEDKYRLALYILENASQSHSKEKLE